MYSKMKIIKLSSENYNQAINEIVSVIEKEGVVICPTDTLYGLIADATSLKAVKKVCKIKERIEEKPIPVFVKNLEMAENLAEINEEKKSFLNNVWPGKVTVILRESKKEEKIGLRISDYGLIKEGKIGFRIPNYNLINDLLERVSKPLTGTSANISGEKGSTDLSEILSQFRDKKYLPDLVVSAGILPSGKASTIIDLSGSDPTILRIGDVSKKELFEKDL